MLPFFLFLILFCTLNSLTFAASDSAYNNFAHCLRTYGISNDRISKILYCPRNTSYNSILQANIRNLRFNTSTTPKPVIIVTPLEVQHVQATVLCTKSTGLQLKIRSGGHDFEGISYVAKVPFIILDMFNLRSISVNIGKKTAWVHAGATIGELYYRIWEKSKVHAYPAGVCTTVGVGGHISGGGYGVLLRKYGLAVDNVLDAQIVNVEGQILDRASMGEDLFWCIKGGGGANFGVVLGYKIKLVPVPKIVTVFQVTRSMEQNATDIVYGWQYLADKMSKNLFIKLNLRPVTGQKIVRAIFTAFFFGDANRLISVMNVEFPELGLQKEDCLEMSWVDSALWWSSFPNGTAMEALLRRTSETTKFAKRKSDYLQTPIPRDGIISIFKKIMELGDVELNFIPYGGRMSEIPENATPFPHRAGIVFNIEYAVSWVDEDPLIGKKHIQHTRELYSFMTPFVSKNPRQAFLNYRDLDIGSTDNGNNSYNEGKAYGLKYFKRNFYKLVKVKTTVDPGNFFRNEQSIPTLPVESFVGGKRGK